MDLGGIEVLSLPGPRHAGFYPFAGVSWVFVHERFLLIPELSVEFSPELGHLGLVGSLVMDFPVGRGVGLDLDAALIQDEPGFHVDQSVLYLGAGVGASWTVGAWTFSSFLNLFRGLQTHDWSLVPGLNVARVL